MTIKEIYSYEEIPVHCAGQSLIGTFGDFPLDWGNYFWVYDNEQHSVRVLNFWWENLKEANEKFNLKGKVKIRKYHWYGRYWCIIDDERIPKEWYYNKLCFTGTSSPPFEIVKDIYEYLGDPTNELEQFTDPKSYYEKRGAKYSNGVITYSVGNPKTRTLKSNYKIEYQQDLKCFFGINAEDELAEELMQEIVKEMDNNK